MKILNEASGDSAAAASDACAASSSSFEDDQRREKAERLVLDARDSILAVLKALPDMNLCLSGENELNRTWVIEKCSGDDFVVSSEEFSESCEALWSDQIVKECFQKMSREHFPNEDKAAAARLLDRAGEIGKPEYLPTDEDMLYCYTPTKGTHARALSIRRSLLMNLEFLCPFPVSGLLESTVRIDRVDFNLREANDGALRDRWVQYSSSDVVAVIFVADASDFGREAMTHSLVRKKNTIYVLLYTTFSHACAIFPLRSPLAASGAIPSSSRSPSSSS